MKPLKNYTKLFNLTIANDYDRIYEYAIVHRSVICVKTFCESILVVNKMKIPIGRKIIILVSKDALVWKGFCPETSQCAVRPVAAIDFYTWSTILLHFLQDLRTTLSFLEKESRYLSPEFFPSLRQMNLPAAVKPEGTILPPIQFHSASSSSVTRCFVDVLNGCLTSNRLLLLITYNLRLNSSIFHFTMTRRDTESESF